MANHSRAVLEAIPRDMIHTMSEEEVIEKYQESASVYIGVHNDMNLRHMMQFKKERPSTTAHKYILSKDGFSHANLE